MNEEPANETDGTTTKAPTSEGARMTPADFESDPSVRVEERTREFDREKFEGLRKRYDVIDGVVMVGVTTADGEVLLQGEDSYVPPGGDVESGEDWEAAARRNVEELTGVDVRVDGAKLVEHTTWSLADGDESFRTTSVHFEASLAGDAPEFRANPTAPTTVEHKYYEESDEPPEFDWYDGVPDAVHPNHAAQVELYVD